ncbi:hypothetical protein LSCM1_02583 [Leishmania martiniquensis]|uniref:Uncharacterized protein n=1 Tax=Leishmania martiniquensis TaxID=1580590 RepID=A0A836G764_9TRYP|nr:hypothetical protein LSCM1_02583 [Leishmania martiniquensis]
MPVAVSMHVCSAWPMSIDLAAFRFFLAGYSAEEAVEQLMLLQSTRPAASLRRHTPSASSSSSTSSSRSSSSCRDLHAGSASSSRSVFRSAVHHRHRRQQRAFQELQHLPSALQDAQQQTEDRRLEAEDEYPQEIGTATTATVPAAAFSRTSSRGRITTGAPMPLNTTKVPSVVSVVDSSRTNAAASRTTAVGLSTALAASHQTQDTHSQRYRHRHQHRRTSMGGLEQKMLHQSASHSSRSRTAATSSITPMRTSLAPLSTLANECSESTPFSGGPSSLRRFTDDFTTSATGAADSDKDGGSGARPGETCDHHFHHVNFGGEKRSSPLQHHRGKRRKDRGERQCFFLDEGYIKFQRQLEKVGETGGAGVGASSLQSRYLFEEVTEQYQMFRELSREEQLGSPYAFLSNYYIPIPVATRLQLLQMYYETDAGVFRWAFGDKLSRFDLPSALSAAREENPAGTLSAGLAGVAGLGSGCGSSSGAADGGGSAASFWTSRWKSSPGKLATMGAATVTRLRELHVGALRRQWENVKHVCVTVAALYRGKGGMCVPLDMPLLTTIQQCFGLRNEQALDYATAAFGFEHRLETRLFEHLHNFSEYGVICSIIASLWCDSSGYFLRQTFCDGCRRLGRLLDEYRILSELHSIVFGETMRPRWQVQLDEVQRVITTSSHVDKNAMASATAAVPATSPATAGISTGGGVATPTTMTCGAPLPSSASPAGVGSGYFGSAFGGNGHAGGAAGVAAPEAGNASTFTGAGGSAVGGAAGTNNVHSPFSGNGQYSRPFLMEFPSLMKHLFRVCVALSCSGGVNDGLDIFFTRIYSYLELLSSRTAPAIVSRMVNAAAAGSSAMAGAASALGVVSPTSAVPGQLGVSTCGSETTPGFASSAAASGRSPLPRYGDRVRSDEDLSHATADSGATMAPPAASTSMPPGAPSSWTTVKSGGTSLSRPLRSGLTRILSSGHLSRQVSGRGCDHADAASLSLGTSAANTLAPAGGSGCVDEDLTGSASFSCAVSTVVNTSLFQPVSVLLPLTAAIAAHNGSTMGSFVSSPLLTRTGSRCFASEEELTNGDAHGGDRHGEEFAQPAAGAARASGCSSPNSGGGFFSAAPQPGPASAAHVPSHVSDMVLKVIDKRYLRELCMLLAALPCAWRQLTVLTRDDHLATDKAVSDLMMALKAITQVLMASDDFQ